MSSAYLAVPGHWQQEERQRLFFMASIFLGLCCAIGALVSGSGRVAMMLLSVGSLGVCSLIFLAMVRLAPEFLLARLIAASYALQCFWLIFVAAFNIGVSDETVLVPDLYQYPYRAVLPNLLVPLAALAAVGVWRMLPLRRAGRRDFWQLTKTAPAGLDFYLVLAALVMLTYWPASQEDVGGWGYAVRILERSFGFMPLLMGRYFRQFPWTNRFFLLVLAINAVIGMTIGGRSVALLPVGLYFIGRILGHEQRKRWRPLAYGALLALPIFALSGAIGAVRGELGRGDFSIFSVERMVDTVNAVWDQMSAESDTGDQATLLNGPGRMVVWPNLSAAILTPENVPYRGFGSFFDETAITFKVSAVSGLSRQDMYDADLSSYPATLYGYMVNTETSVEWGLLADGWSRGGPWATLLFGFILSMVFITVEYVLLTRKSQSLSTLLVYGVLVISAVVYPATSTLLYVIRQTALDCGLIFLVTTVIALLQPRLSVVFADSRDSVFSPSSNRGLLRGVRKR